ncbi:efflux RND transporter permease subunit [Candidatus Venteria ishoeyi]|uniref:Multidrug resistance protein MdtC n=1 Tax=Candidatus Venteria ishoeyi TaxID=1899563 RepID=A0A1H6FF31_9GAMM|nr:efflux RND transporter permease subunit [Candidatus Venteria ishoeyi]SEH08680.1 Multidrug resistance protein MdtC [Candidatus Venteria ishoeyi]
MTDQQKSPDTDTNEEHLALGLAGNTAKAFIHSPLSPLFFISMLAMGLIGLFLTPRQEDPQISVPMADIFVHYPGASAEEVASLAIEPLQRMLSEIPAVKHVYAASGRGQGMVTVEFKVGEELERSIFKVHDKLQSNADKIPPGVSKPVVKPKGIDDVPVVNLTLWSETVDDGNLRTLAFDVLQVLKEIPNTGPGFVVGGRTEQMRVEIMPERLSGFNLSLDQVANTIRTANSEIKVGDVESSDTHFTVYSGAFVRNAGDISHLVVGIYNDMPVYVRDVATVFQGPEEVSKMVNYFSGPSYHYTETEDGTGVAVDISAAPAVTIAVAKKIGTNGVAVANDILAKVEKLKGRLIPDNVHIEVTRDYGKSANDKVNGLIKKLFIATGAVTILVLISLGWRPAIVVTLVIPVVILMTVFSAFALGFTIDRVSLFALIFSIGILVDDAIVVIENIYRRWLLKGEIDTETAVDAVREVGNPTILATFTVVAALLPMGFVRGMMGPYMMPIPVLGSVAMIFSLFAAFAFTPWLAMALKPSIKSLHKAEQKEHAFNEKLEGFFRHLLTPLISSRAKGWLFLIALVVAFFMAISMFYFRTVEVKMLPLDNKPEFNVFINMPDGTALPVTANMAYQLAEVLRKVPEVTALQTYVGTSQPFDFNGMVRHYYLRQQSWEADIHVQLRDKYDRDRSSHQIVTDVRRQLQAVVKDTGIKVTVVEMPPGPPVLQSIVAEVYGPDDNIRREVAAKMTEVFEQAKIVDDVDNYMSDSHTIWRFQVDTEKAVRRGISVDTINRNLSMAMGGYHLGDVKHGPVLEPTLIVIQAPLKIRSQLTRLYDLPIPTQDQQNTVPLAELGRFISEPEDLPIFYKDLRRIEYVVGDAVGIHQGDNKYSEASGIYGMMEIEDLLQEYTTPDGIVLSGNYLAPPKDNIHSGFEWTGEWTVTYETFRDMGLAFAVAMVLIYLLVVGLFGNFLIPAIIMAPIPLTLLGIVPGHWLLDAEFTATSMIGWIALAGIIVRNSILLVDYSIHELKHGTRIEDAVILACKTRTRPIMITAFALVGGGSVILFDPIFQGMAISLLFGVLISTLLTLVVIPLGCISAGAEALLGDDDDLPPSDNTPPSNNNGGGSGSGSGNAADNSKAATQTDTKTSTAMASSQPSIKARVMNVLTMGFYLLRAVAIMAWMAIQGLWQKYQASKVQPQARQTQPAPKMAQAATKTTTDAPPQTAAHKTEATTTKPENMPSSVAKADASVPVRKARTTTKRTRAATGSRGVQGNDLSQIQQPPLNGH